MADCCRKMKLYKNTGGGVLPPLYSCSCILHVIRVRNCSDEQFKRFICANAPQDAAWLQKQGKGRICHLHLPHRKCGGSHQWFSCDFGWRSRTLGKENSAQSSGWPNFVLFLGFGPKKSEDPNTEGRRQQQFKNLDPNPEKRGKKQKFLQLHEGTQNRFHARSAA